MTDPTPCETCGHTEWGNPIPVVTIIQPIHSDLLNRTGLAMAKRADPPYVGQWALLGGHVDGGNYLEQAAVREWREETGLVIREHELTYVGSRIASNGKLLVGFTAPPISIEEWSMARLCRENLEFGICWDEADRKKLCFPIHQEFAGLFFDGALPFRN